MWFYAYELNLRNIIKVIQTVRLLLLIILLLTFQVFIQFGANLEPILHHFAWHALMTV